MKTLQKEDSSAHIIIFWRVLFFVFVLFFEKIRRKKNECEEYSNCTTTVHTHKHANT